MKPARVKEGKDQKLNPEFIEYFFPAPRKIETVQGRGLVYLLGLD
jgi:hypothetical protein